MNTVDNQDNVDTIPIENITMNEDREHLDQVGANNLDNNENRDNTQLVGAHNEYFQQEGVQKSVMSTYEETFMNEVRSLPARRAAKPKKHFDEIQEVNVVDESSMFLRSMTAEICEPKTLNEALESQNSVEWKEAINSEYVSLIKNQTWELVPRPSNVNVVGNRWVFKIKRKADGTIDRFKARLVAQGFTQTQGLDYNEVFSPVARSSTIRGLLAIANHKDWDIHQMDVKAAFLNSELDYEVFMEQPKGFIDEVNKDYVCKLKRCLYGLKQSSRCWNLTLDEFLKSNDYIRCGADECVYIKIFNDETKGEQFVIHVIYVDDIINMSNNLTVLENEKGLLSDKFEMVDNGELHYVLGMMVKRNRQTQTLSLSQPSYLETVLEKFGMSDCKPVSTPMDLGTHFQKRTQEETPFPKQVYQQAIGCLTYASTSTRPDIAAAVGVLSQYMSDPSHVHWCGVKRLFRYLKGTKTYGLLFTSDGSNVLHGYTDADWAGDLDTHRSTSGYVFRVGYATISWCSKRQQTVAKSTTEAEYVALSFSVSECIWLRRLLQDIGCDTDMSTVIYEDNNGAIDLSKNAKHHTRTKHTDISYHFTREKVDSEEVAAVYIQSDDNIADVMTKALPRVMFQKFCDRLGVFDVNSVT